MILYHKKLIKQIKYENKVWFFLHFFAFASIIDYVLYVINLSMKKVFVQFRQWILKHRKRLIYGALALFIGQICFLNIWWIQNQVFAQNSSDRESATQKSSFEKIVNERVSLYDFFKKTAYTLVYPMMFLAGKLVDNSLIYWEMFKFDIVLWKLWNVIKNFANYGLGFLFIYYLFRYLITQDKNKNPKWLIIRSLIAWVWIQASWFLMSVLIDISTIMIYGIWGLPLSILWWAGSTSEDTDSYVMKNIITVDANDISNTHFYLTNILSWAGGTQIYISECATFAIKDSKGNKGSDEYILGPKMIYYQNQKWDIFHTKKDLCNYYGSVYKFKELNENLLKEKNGINVGTERDNCSDINKCQNAQSAYDANKDSVRGGIKSYEDVEKYQGQILIPWNKVWNLEYGWDEDNKWIGEQSGFKTQKMSELMKSQETKTYVWVFTSLYSSLLEAWRWMIPDTDASPYIKLLSCILTLGHALAIAIPLAVALLVLLMRVAIIWMAIVLSPMIVLLSAFGFLDGKWKSNDIWGYFNLESLISIIFSPVVICFAISMSTVLVRLIDKMNFKEEVFKNSFEVMWIIHMDLGWFSVWLSKLIVWVMWVAISWFLVWMAVESSKLWKTGFIQSIKNLATSSLWAVPIVPVIWKDWTQQLASVNSAKRVVENKYREVVTEFNNGETKALSELFDGETAQEEAAKKAATAKESAEKENNVQNFVNWLNSQTIINSNWMDGIDVNWKTMKFNSFDWSQKKKIIEQINGLSEDVIKRIWNATPESGISFEVDGKKVNYKFNGKIFEEQK